MNKTRSYKNLAFHPYNIMLVLIMAGVAALFFGLVVSYIYNRIYNEVPAVLLPMLFYFNSIFLFGSSIALENAKKSFKTDNVRSFKNSLVITILFTFCFLIGQIFAWGNLFIELGGMRSSQTVSYLYLISGVHIFHIIAGMPFLCMFLYTAMQQIKGEVPTLIYFSDPEKKLQLRMLALYWHFLDFIWIFLLISFIFGMNL